MYRTFFKRLLDIILSGCAIVILSPLLLIIAVAIKIDDPGPVLFRQKRVGIHKTHFSIMKFRTMKMDTPKDTPTHLLENPEQYITKVGKILRKSSLDELPQIFQIFTGKMSIIGPRPALWNQFDLIAERDKYGANDVRPGLTGWAQINGRDELPIEVKARFDGEYVEKLSFLFDCKCFFGTIGAVLKHDGVVEGGTGQLKRRRKNEEHSHHRRRKLYRGFSGKLSGEVAGKLPGRFAGYARHRLGESFLPRLRRGVPRGGAGASAGQQK